MFTFQVDLIKLTGGENSKGISQAAANPELVLRQSLSRTPDVCLGCGVEPPPVGPFPPGGWVPPNPEIELGILFGKIVDLSNGYIIYAQNHQHDSDDPGSLRSMKVPPWENSNELFNALSKYTGVPANSEKIQNVKNFFYSIMKSSPQDPNKDGEQDVNDVFAIWSRSSGGEQGHKGDINGVDSAIRALVIALGKPLSDSGEFLSQLRGPANINEDASNNNANCGPTSVAMVLGDFGIEKTDAFGADEEIEHVRRDDMLAGTNEYEPVYPDQIVFALSKHGLSTKKYYGVATTNDIDNELKKGNELIVHLNSTVGGWGIGKRHFVVVVGKEASGNYIIKDPLDNGPRTVSQNQIQAAMLDYYSRGGYMIAVGK